jgi:hypothetical protein
MKHFFTILAVLLAVQVFAQSGSPVQFTASFERSSDTSGYVVIKARMTSGFQLFSANRQSDEDPFITSVQLDSATAGMRHAMDSITEVGRLQYVSSGSGSHYRLFADSVTFKIPVHFAADFAGKISGSIAWLPAMSFQVVKKSLK